MKNKLGSNIGLALGGGAVLGAVHIGVLKALEEADIQVSCISGTSIGAFIATLFAFGNSSSEIESIVSDQGWLDVSSFAFNKMGFLSNAKLGKLVSSHIGEKTFSDAKLPLALVACDIIQGKKVVLTSGDVCRAIMASTCVPGVFEPVRIGDQLLVDGGIVENIPLSPLEEFDCETIVGVDLTNIKNTDPKNMFDVLMNTLNIAQNNAAMLQQTDAHIVISPDLSAFDLIDTRQIPELIKVGYEAAVKTIDERS